MFDANIEEKQINNGFDVFMNVTTTTLNNVNNTQYFLPGLTFFFVWYTYYVVGEGKVWKYLLYTTLFGFIASSLTNMFNTFKIFFSLDYVLQIKWIENIFWHLNEYGYVYITFIKLRTVVEELRKKQWNYVMNILFIYNFIVRLFISLVTIVGRTAKAGSHFQMLSFLPLSFIEFIFMCLIVKAFIKQSENQMTKDLISTMLNSTLTRMFIVGLIYFLVSVVGFYYSPPILKGIKQVVFRAKSSLGLIFLLDLLYIHIDLKKKVTTQQNLLNVYSRNPESTLYNSISIQSPKFMMDNNMMTYDPRISPIRGNGSVVFFENSLNS